SFGQTADQTKTPNTTPATTHTSRLSRQVRIMPAHSPPRESGGNFWPNHVQSRDLPQLHAVESIIRREINPPPRPLRKILGVRIRAARENIFDHVRAPFGAV